MEKIFVVDKPAGKTSYQIVAQFKKRFPGEKVGHAGTLDPLASGVLIILVGRNATKRQSEFMALEKQYLVEASFGIVTETWDLEKPPIAWETNNLAAKLNDLSEVKIKKVLADFEGEFDQIIPAFSAVKRDGVRLYKQARQGKLDLSSLPRKKVNLKKLTLERFAPSSLTPDEIIDPNLILKKGPKARIRMQTNKGTYVRSVVFQLGQALGVGAVTSRLRRTRVGRFEARNKPYTI